MEMQEKFYIINTNESSFAIWSWVVSWWNLGGFWGEVKVNLGVIRKGKYRIFILFCLEEGFEWNRLKIQRALQNSVSS